MLRCPRVSAAAPRTRPGCSPLPILLFPRATVPFLQAFRANPAGACGTCRPISMPIQPRAISQPTSCPDQGRDIASGDPAPGTRAGLAVQHGSPGIIGGSPFHLAPAPQSRACRRASHWVRPEGGDRSGGHSRPSFHCRRRSQTGGGTPGTTPPGGGDADDARRGEDFPRYVTRIHSLGRRCLLRRVFPQFQRVGLTCSPDPSPRPWPGANPARFRAHQLRCFRWQSNARVCHRSTRHRQGPRARGRLRRH